LLQRYRQFELTGREMSMEVFSELLRESNKWVKSPSWKYWCSGDFSGATDNLNMDVTLMIIKHLSGDPYTFSVLERGLLRNRIGYGTEENKMGGSVEDILQSNGQLMGCVFSFPILCIANLAAYCYTLDSSSSCRIPTKDGGISDFYGRDFDRLPVRVNGDDILFKTDLVTYRRWEQVVASIGLFKSVGKNYLKEDLAIVNSMMFKGRLEMDQRRDKEGKLIREGKMIRTWLTVPFVNMGWAEGVRKGEEAAVGRLHTRAQTEELEEEGKGFETLVSYRSSVEEQRNLIERSGFTIGKPFWEGIISRFEEVAFERRREAAIGSHLHFGSAGNYSFGREDDGKSSLNRAFSHFLQFSKTPRARPCSSIRKEMGGWWKLADVEVAKKYEPLTDSWARFNKWARLGRNKKLLDLLSTPIKEWVRWDGKLDTLAPIKLSLGLPPFCKRWKACRLRENQLVERHFALKLVETPGRGQALCPALLGPQPKRRGLELFERNWSL